MPTKRCRECDKIKDYNEFYNWSHSSDGKQSYCIPCKKKRDKKYMMDKYGSWSNWYEQKGKQQLKEPWHVYKELKYRSKKKGMKFPLDKEKFEEWYRNQEKKCDYCSLPEEYVDEVKTTLAGKARKLSIDRVDNEKPYLIDNITLACIRCNHIKGDYFSYEEMKEIAEEYIEPKWRDKLGSE